MRFPSFSSSLRPLAFAGALALSPGAHATTLAKWDFGPTSTAGLPAFWTNSTQNLPADQGSGTLSVQSSGFFSSAQATVAANSPLTSPDDGTKGISISQGDRTNGTFTITLSTLGYQDLAFQLDYAETGNQSVFSWLGISVSSGGTNYFSASMTQGASWVRESFDLSGIPELNNQPEVTIRFTGRNTQTNNVSGSGAVDNLIVSGSAIPEPSIGLLVGPALLLTLRRGRR